MTRRPRRRALTSLSLLTLATAAAGAQEPAPAAPAFAPTPAPGDTVRLLVGPPTQRRRGTVVAVTPDALTLRFRGADAAAVVPWSRVYKIEASRGRGPSRENLGRWMIGGAFAGVSVAYLFFSADEERIAGRVGVASAIGAAAGAAAALSRPGPHRWSEVFRPDAPALEDAMRRARPSLATHTTLAVQWGLVPLKQAASSTSGAVGLQRDEVVGASALTVRAGTYGLVGGSLPYVEAFYTRVAPRADDGTPEMHSFGAIAGGWTGRDASSSRLSLFLGGGLGLLRANAAPSPPCGEFSLLCVRYGDATVVNAIADIGAFVSLLEMGAARRRLGLRTDARLHLPVSPKGDAGATARTRGEVAAGLQIEL